MSVFESYVLLKQTLVKLLIPPIEFFFIGIFSQYSWLLKLLHIHWATVLELFLFLSWSDIGEKCQKLSHWKIWTLGCIIINFEILPVGGWRENTGRDKEYNCFSCMSLMTSNDLVRCVFFLRCLMLVMLYQTVKSLSS